MRRGLHSLGLAVVVGLLAAGPAPAAAQDGDGLRLMRQPTRYTDVIDAFDGQDPFDFNFRLGFRHERTHGDIQREVQTAGGDPAMSDPDAAAGRDTFRDVASYQHVRNILDLQADIGLYKDLAFFVKLPVIVSDERTLSRPRPDREQVNEDLKDLRSSSSGMGQPLFDVPFDSPTRSGLDHVGLGLAWSIFNQYRSPSVPTWLIMFEAQLNAGKEMRPCSQGSSGDCDPDEPGDQGAGVSRGMNTIRAETRVSRRFRYVEPYSGLGFQMEFPGKASNLFTPGGGDLPGFQNTRPPIRGEFTAGLAVIPWERRDRFQRLTLDFRIQGEFASEGRDYSPLFDALGTSDSPYLAEPNCEGIPTQATGEDNPCGGGREVPFTGTTTVAPHGRLGGQVGLDVRVARYVQFGLGFGVFYTTPHMITATDPCNPGASADMSGDGPDLKGKCRGNAIINPNHRAVIASPGNRFKLDGAVTFNFAANATARF